MTRRFATLAAATVVLAGVPLAPSWAQAPGGVPPSKSSRTAKVLDDGWRFRQGGEPANVTDNGFDDSAWQTVSVPHTWNRVGFYRPDPASHIHRAETVDKTQGLGWYRQRFTVPAEMRGKSIWLEFDAAWMPARRSYLPAKTYWSCEPTIARRGARMPRPPTYCR
jgi:beta-galactosidase